MNDRLYPLLRPLLFRLDPERAHRLTIRLLKLRGRKPPPDDDPILRTMLPAFGLDLRNPIGIAAGFDKDADAPAAVLGLGFGFVEVGTLTPLPQPGNPKPRLFRLAEDRAVINRLGFNNGGHVKALERIKAAKARGLGPLGVNIGANKDSDDRIRDYALGISRFAPFADYFTVNVSSPNTPGLRDLQGRAALMALLDAVMTARAGATRQPPVLLKIAPDISEQQCDDIAEVALLSGIEGLIISNTTIARPESLRSSHRQETGGLSGAPLLAPSTALLAAMRRRTEGKLTLIGVGGVSSGADAYEKIRAGASLVQLYTALVYEGPGLIGRIKTELAALLRRDGFRSVAEAVGADQR